jgi:hypothetical protein
MYVLLNYFGYTIKIDSEISIINRISSIFKEFITDDKNIISIYFRVEPTERSSNFELVSSQDKFRINYSYDGKSYQNWEFRDTFLPPLQLSPFANKYFVLHGCAMRYKSKTIAFLAPSMAGKTSLLLYLISKGFKAISDDLLFIDFTKQKVLPYKKPVGVRETGLDIIPKLRDMLNKCINNDTMIFYNFEGKRTWLTHLDDLFQDNVFYEKESKIDIFIKIDSESDSNIKKMPLVNAYDYILESICNSGLDTSKINETIIQILKESTLYTLPTRNLQLAYMSILNIINNE